MTMITTHTLNVNLAERGKDPNVRMCELTLDWSNVSEEAICDLAAQRVIAGVTQTMRNHGNVPAKKTYNVAEFGQRIRDPMAALRTLARTLTREQLEEFCAERGLTIA